jgi:adenosyl cobinamide kinase/adenosyl cobinamide phosphate guanylyltransferase
MPGRDGTTLLFGQARSGRYLLAVLAESGDGRWHVVTARSMTEAERRVFKKKAKRP